MTPPQLVADLRAALATSGEAAHARTTALCASAPAGVLADAALLLLQTLREEDGWLDMTAAGILLDQGEARHLAPLRAIRPGLRPRVALRDWRLEVDRAIAGIEARAAGRCTCAAEAAHGASVNGPEWIVESQSYPEPYRTTHLVRCARCGRRWTVDEEDGYHYPIFRWGSGTDS